MGGNISGLCCQNENVIKIGEDDLQLYKKESKKHRLDDEDSIPRLKIQKDVLEKHLKDNSFKQNCLSNSQIEKERVRKYKDYFKYHQSVLLTLKILNSNLDTINKGEVIRINCMGLLEGISKDGRVLFGHIDNKNRIDYDLPFQSSDQEISL
jgi:hypothetical protein